MTMPNVRTYSSGNRSFVLLRPETKWDLKFRASMMALFILMRLAVLSGCGATKARRLITWSMSPRRRNKTLDFPTLVIPMSTGSIECRDPSKWVTKHVAVVTLFPVVALSQKTTPRKVL